MQRTLLVNQRRRNQCSVKNIFLPFRAGLNFRNSNTRIKYSRFFCLHWQCKQNILECLRDCKFVLKSYEIWRNIANRINIAVFVPLYTFYDGFARSVYSGLRMFGETRKYIIFMLNMESWFYTINFITAGQLCLLHIRLKFHVHAIYILKLQWALWQAD